MSSGSGVTGKMLRFLDGFQRVLHMQTHRSIDVIVMFYSHVRILGLLAYSALFYMTDFAENDNAHIQLDKDEENCIIIDVIIAHRVFDNWYLPV
ncbi:hypothetical protein R6Q59_007172 [Mikania micrantha]